MFFITQSFIPRICRRQIARHESHRKKRKFHFETRVYVFLEARKRVKKRMENPSVDAIVVVGNQFQVVVQAQGAHEQTRASRITERCGASQVYTSDHCEAAHAKSTMEREVSFVSSPLGTFFFFFFFLFPLFFFFSLFFFISLSCCLFIPVAFSVGSEKRYGNALREILCRINVTEIWFNI